MKKWTYLFLGLLSSFILIGSQVKPESDQILWETAKKLGIQVNQIVYHHGSRMQEPVEFSQVDQLVSQMANDLKLPSVQKQESSDGVRYQSQNKVGSLTTQLTVVNDQPRKKWCKPYISMQMVLEGDSRLEPSIHHHLNRFFAQYRITPQLDYSLQGSKSFQHEPKEQLIQETFAHLQAKEVEAVRTRQVVSVSAWSPMLSGSIKTHGGLMNLQVATRINEETQQLLFTIGSPIITIEY